MLGAGRSPANRFAVPRMKRGGESQRMSLFLMHNVTQVLILILILIDFVQAVLARPTARISYPDRAMEKRGWPMCVTAE